MRNVWQTMQHRAGNWQMRHTVWGTVLLSNNVHGLLLMAIAVSVEGHNALIPIAGLDKICLLLHNLRVCTALFPFSSVQQAAIIQYVHMWTATSTDVLMFYVNSLANADLSVFRKTPMVFAQT